MRIISGKYKGRRISAPSNITARPTTDFAKEGLFNLLNNRMDFEGIDVLDLFAGTGGISIEFVSRDCKSVISIEQNDRHCAFIRKVCAELKIDNLSLLKTDVFKFINSCHTQFDMIFADPPYELNRIEEIPDLIFSHNLLKEDGLFVLEHSAKTIFTNHPNFVDHRNYGNVNFSFFEVKK
ncbi:methyltransferase [Paludibacter propionicigenes WB4]|uniref:Methyltransferase n=1 Tax=Paludibacter propionicigenes (strain DSM 17365 / JCM 13257 / WB4) TaxID=694427 RepID=E4T4I0_PALPW|nr:16S rRNA (guanine(966)-N(2))-methyltransferase RsmD [Paludibacter propionicigenes]ADQ79624.1 methyltransferase [Paludibacter propionicigenes WB4]